MQAEEGGAGQIMQHINGGKLMEEKQHNLANPGVSNIMLQEGRACPVPKRRWIQGWTGRVWVGRMALGDKQITHLVVQ